MQRLHKNRREAVFVGKQFAGTMSESNVEGYFMMSLR